MTDMDFLHYEVDLGPGQGLLVDLDRQANVQVMDSMNFQRYRRGQAYRYFGGRALRSPVPIKPPHAGRWHVAIDLGGASGRLRADVRVV
jgi:hypothetical protein